MTLLVLQARLLFRRFLGIRDVRTARLRREIAEAKASRSA